MESPGPLSGKGRPAFLTWGQNEYSEGQNIKNRNRAFGKKLSFLENLFEK